jgi:hypothetical protein
MEVRDASSETRPWSASRAAPGGERGALCSPSPQPATPDWSRPPRSRQCGFRQAIATSTVASAAAAAAAAWLQRPPPGSLGTCRHPPQRMAAARLRPKLVRHHCGSVAAAAAAAAGTGIDKSLRPARRQCGWAWAQTRAAALPRPQCGGGGVCPASLPRCRAADPRAQVESEGEDGGAETARSPDGRWVRHRCACGLRGHLSADH